MKAFALTRHGQPEEVLQVLQVPKPQPGPRDLIVRVHGVATNPVDVKQITNTNSKPIEGTSADSPFVAGWDASGVVDSIGSDVSLFKPGDQVYFAGVINRPGCFAELVAVDERIVGRRPSSLSHEDAAAIPLTALTAWELLVEGFGIPIPSGDENVNQHKSVLVVGGAGGVGSMALQIAKRVLKIGRVIGTASRPDTVQFAKDLGADNVIDHSHPLTEELAKLGVQGVDYVFLTNEPDPVIEQAVQLVNPLGKIGSILPITKAFGQLPLFFKRASVVYELMFTRGLFGVEPEKQGELLTTVAGLVDAGVLRSTANARFPWAQLPQALALQASGKAIGKIVLSVAF